jgi:hypothetical protein
MHKENIVMAAITENINNLKAHKLSEPTHLPIQGQ